MTVPSVGSSPRVCRSAQAGAGGQCPLCLGGVARYFSHPCSFGDLAGAGRVLRAAQHPALLTKLFPKSLLLPCPGSVSGAEQGLLPTCVVVYSLPWERQGLRSCLRCLPGNFGSRLLCFPGDCVPWCCPACVAMVQEEFCLRPVAFLFSQPAPPWQLCTTVK